MFERWSRRAVLPGAAAAAMGGALFLACSTGGPQTIASLSLSSADPLTPAVGQTVTVTARAVMTDGSSIDVTDRATCSLDSADPPGTFAGVVFTATRSGTTNVVCAFHEVVGTLGITVPGALHTTVAEVQGGGLAQGTSLEISAVVFGIDPDGRYTNFWAQDPGGGAKSGIYFRDVRKLDPDAGAGDAGAAAPVAEGDLVTVTGVYAERSGRSVINWSDVTKTGAGQPKADVVPLAQLDPAIWDGCLVEIDHVVVVNPSFDAYTWLVADGANPTGSTIQIETLLYPTTPASGQTFRSITGPLYVATFPMTADGAIPPAEVAVTPRRASDLVP